MPARQSRAMSTATTRDIPLCMETERRALTELNQLVQDYINSNRYKQEISDELGEERIPLLTNPISTRPVSLWGVPLLQDERTDVILSKFLEETRFSVRDSFTMIRNTLRWRTGFGVDYYDNTDNINHDGYYTRGGGEGYSRFGTDREGRPVCYCWIRNYYPESSYSGGYRKDSLSGRVAKRCTRSWILSLERMIRRHVDFRPGGVNGICLVNDIFECSFEMCCHIKFILPLLHQYYPQTIAFQVFINNPPLIGCLNPFWKSKFVAYDVHQIPDTLFKYISPDQLSIRYGGLNTDNLNRVVPVFSEDDPPAELHGFGSSKSIRITTSVCMQDCLHFWELRVVSSNSIVHGKYRYSVEFVPKSGGSSNVISVCEVPDMECKGDVVCGGYKATSPGSLLFLVIKLSGSNKTVVFRHKTAPQPDDREPPRYFRCPETGKMYTKKHMPTLPRPDQAS